MQFSYYTFGSGARNYAEQIEHAKRYGCTGIEPLTNLDFASGDPEPARAIRALLDENRMSCPCFSMYVEIMRDENAFRRICRAIDQAAILGAPYFHHTLGPVAYPDQPFSEYLGIAVDMIRRTSDYAAQYGIRILIEPQGRMMNGIERLSALYEAVDRPIGAVLDTGNILQSPDSCEEYIRVFAPYIKHVHIKDKIIRDRLPLCPDGKWALGMDGLPRFSRPTVVGQGDLDLVGILGMLKALDYDGWYSLEYDAPEAFEPYYRVSQKNFAELYRRVFGEEA